MSNQPKENDLLDQLFTGLKDFLNTPLPGTTPANAPNAAGDQSATVVEDGVLYDKLKEIVGTSSDSENNVDGVNFEKDASTSVSSTRTMPTAKEDWAALRENHKKEREELSARHACEREAMKAYRAKISESKKRDRQSQKQKAKDDNSEGRWKGKKKGKNGRHKYRDCD